MVNFLIIVLNNYLVSYMCVCFYGLYYFFWFVYIFCFDFLKSVVEFLMNVDEIIFLKEEDGFEEKEEE